MYLSFGFGDGNSEPGSASAQAEESTRAEAASSSNAGDDTGRREAQMAILVAVERGEMSPQEAMQQLDELED